jgi:hypothetical protein
MEYVRFGSFEVRREEPLQQQLPTVLTLLVVVQFLW